MRDLTDVGAVSYGHSGERYVLEVIDSNTACVIRDVAIDESAARVFEIIGVDSETFLANDPVGNVSATLAAAICREVGVAGTHPGTIARIRRREGTDDLPYKIHTNRELLLMLEGTKPLASFCEVLPDDKELDLIPEKAFEKHVVAGTIFMQEQFVNDESLSSHPTDGKRKLRYVLYALPGEEWRVDAYLQLVARRVAGEWSEALETQEGELLGYTRSQMEAYMAHLRSDVEVRRNWKWTR